MSGAQDQLEIKFRLTDGSDIGLKNFPAAMSVAALKENIIAQWPKECRIGTGSTSACGSNGFARGGGGRVSVDIFSKRDEHEISVKVLPSTSWTLPSPLETWKWQRDGKSAFKGISCNNMLADLDSLHALRRGKLLWMMLTVLLWAILILPLFLSRSFLMWMAVYKQYADEFLKIKFVPSFGVACGTSYEKQPYLI